MSVTILSESLFLSSNDETSSEKRNSLATCCRICHEDSSIEKLIDPCECSGTLALIHTSCLEKWLTTSNTEHCEICKHSFYIKRINKSIFKSVWLWSKSREEQGARGIAGDAISLVILTPLCLAATYLCGIGASTYSRLGFWEGTGLAILCCMLIATYCLWFSVTFRFHYKSWREWREQNQDVKLMEKHCTEEERKKRRLLSTRKSFSDARNDRNGRSVITVIRPREFSWFGATFSASRDPLFVLQQTTFV